MSSSLRLFASAPRGIEPLLADELRALGAGDVKETRAGVTFSGDLALAYRVCLWSRVANRVLLPLAQFPAPTPEALYDGVRGIDWSAHLDQNGTLAVDFNTYRSAITHTHYGALKVKDAIVDQFRERTGVRPSVATNEPDVRINVYVHADVASLSIDLSGESLHRRGYRVDTVTAPLKENLAAAILLRAGWPAIAREGGALVDLMCGSGTLPIEAALIAGDSAPGLDRAYFGFLRWRGHDAGIWEALLTEARARRDAGIKNLPPIRGYDSDPAAVRAAIMNVEHAGLTGLVHIERRYLADCRSEHVERAGQEPKCREAHGCARAAAGLVVVNPPYGERLGEESELPGLYRVLGEVLKRCYEGWRAVVFTGNPELGKVMGLRAHKMHLLYNGAIECKLLHFEVIPRQFVTERDPAHRDMPAARDAESGERPVERSQAPGPVVLTPGAGMFANRLRKNLKQLGKWAGREEICCYRLYDADMPEYALAIDLYQGAARWAHVQEYAAPKTIDPDKASERLQEALSAIPGVLGIPAEQIFLKVRQRQKGSAQYERLAEHGAFHEVQEDGLRLLVNFTDYLDTGLFLDHRLTRRMLRELAKDKRFLNLFGYTGAATVHAAAGARATTTVDMSRTYLDWARRNLALNGFEGQQHELIQADVLVWLEEETERRYELIFLDPPTFSTSKRMQDTLDIQRDHVPLIQSAARLLSPGGTLIFSTNFRRFRLDQEELAEFVVEDISRATLPKDFERNPRIHQCFKLVRCR
jgi:23S rRNA (guanine2445-N2)-methyltransferase / 23S rRNA (guanine2069-N7)-methyltransferase